MRAKFVTTKSDFFHQKSYVTVINNFGSCLVYTDRVNSSSYVVSYPYAMNRAFKLGVPVRISRKILFYPQLVGNGTAMDGTNNIGVYAMMNGVGSILSLSWAIGNQASYPSTLFIYTLINGAYVVLYSTSSTSAFFPASTAVELTTTWIISLCGNDLYSCQLSIDFGGSTYLSSTIDTLVDPVFTALPTVTTMFENKSSDNNYNKAAYMLEAISV